MSNKNKHYKLFALIFGVALFAGFLFLPAEKASADGACAYTANGSTVNLTVTDNAACQSICSSSGGANTGCSFIANITGVPVSGDDYLVNGDKALAPYNGTQNDVVCKGTSILSPQSWINCFLLYVLRFVGFLLKSPLPFSTG